MEVVQYVGRTTTPNVNADILKEPYEGMTFNSSDEVRDYYTDYGRHMGFSERIRSTNKTRFHVDEVTGIHFVCSREGKRRKRQKLDGVDELSRNGNTIVNGCKAQMRVLYNEELRKWVVTRFSNDHNHNFVTPSKRIPYEKFGNVVTFDTTYRTNKYGLPFAPFSGVNHHYQTIQFGCALLRDETEVSFIWLFSIWLFSIWLEAIWGRHPISIITDQDLAMRATIKKLTDSIRFKSEEGEKDNEFDTYLVSAKVGLPEQFVVKLKKGTYDGHCGCQYFEFMGLPFDKCESSEVYRLSHLCRRSTQVWCVASRNEKLYKLALEGIEVLFMKILEEDSKFIQHNENQLSSGISTVQELDHFLSFVVKNISISRISNNIDRL
ncbi:hypothetical protein Ddye_028551 [Dipteronia dyeriana]|uniref:Protein FAR1-RELATED SEQUENCE n=1 Tax=Dipteronia dyeriana TaxID=168575 RepID=A0AAD9TCS6_9ROSI|nr:hypothetical protein Ddye_028551 [Dipteronia dyeriana]